MTNLNTLVSVLQIRVTDENNVRFGGKTRLKVEVPKLEIVDLKHRVLIEYHSGVQNHFCVFIDTFDDAHCAAYVYVWEQEETLKCTLRISDTEGEREPEGLADIPKSLDDDDIAQRLIDSLIDGTERTTRQ